MGCNSPEMLGTGGWSATSSAANEAFTASTICWTSDGGKDIVVGAAVVVEDPAEEAKLVEGDGNIASRQLRVERDMPNKPGEYWQQKHLPRSTRWSVIQVFRLFRHRQTRSVPRGVG